MIIAKLAGTRNRVTAHRHLCQSKHFLRVGNRSLIGGSSFPTFPHTTRSVTCDIMINVQHVCIYVFVYLSVCLYAHTRVCVYTCLCVCVCAYVCTCCTIMNWAAKANGLRKSCDSASPSSLIPRSSTEFCSAILAQDGSSDPATRVKLSIGVCLVVTTIALISDR